jgi:outer membrane lipoprotein-sorting protein
VSARPTPARLTALACAAALICLAGGTRAQPPAGARADLAAVMALLAAHRHSHVTYTERHTLSTLTRPLESSGELLYEAPGHLEKRTLRPRPETLIADGGTITDIRKGHTRVFALEDYPQVVPLIDSIRSTLAGDLPALERLFQVTWQGNTGLWHLRLAPREADMSQTVREIQITGNGAQLRSVDIRQPDGDGSLLILGPEIP